MASRTPCRSMPTEGGNAKQDNLQSVNSSETLSHLFKGTWLHGQDRGSWKAGHIQADISDP